MATKKFKCKVCGYIHEGDKAPDVCPVCKAPASQFEEVTEEKSGNGAKKGGLFSNKNSNAYIIFYATVMVVIVAILLSLASLSLQQRQYDNELGEKKSNILQSLGTPTATSTRRSGPTWLMPTVTRPSGPLPRSST